MFKVGSWFYGKKPAAHVQSLDSLVELRDREFFPGILDLCALGKVMADCYSWG